MVRKPHSLALRGLVPTVVLLAAGLTAAGATPATAATTSGSGKADTITGTSRNDTLNGRGGKDRLIGGKGRDTINGGAGRDTLIGGRGDDKLNGGSGKDVLKGGPGNDVLRGGTGPDTIVCGSGTDTVYADSKDTLKGCEGDTIIRSSNPLATPYNKATPMPVRLQWNANFGYCGESSFIGAGLRLGQYTSQWTARDLASGGDDQWEQGSQLLLGSAPQGNALIAASAMRLKATAINTTSQSTASYLAWIKQQVVSGNSVIMGVYNNVNILGESGSGDPYYDHIVPVIGIGSQQPLSASSAGTYFASDTITISDNGLYTPHPNSDPNVPGNTTNNPAGSALYTYEFGKFQKTRAQANAGYSLADLYSVRKSAPNFAASVSGVVDNTEGGPVTVPVSLTPSVNNEGFQNEDYMHAAPATSPLTLTANVQIPDQTKAYNLYRYDSFSSVPRSNFNANADRAAQSWTIAANSGATVSKTITTTTGSTQVFRAVPVGAP